MSASIRVTIQVAGGPYGAKVLDHQVDVAGVPEHEVISVLMAAVARILVMPVAATGKAAPCST